MNNLIKILKYIFAHPLGSRHKIISFSLFISWQLRQYLFPGVRNLKFFNGAQMSVQKNDTGVTGNIYVGIQDFSEISFALHFLTKNDVFVDVGANVGFYSIVLSKSKEVKSYAFEPILSTFDKMTNNIRLNNIEHQISAINFAVGASSGRFKMSSDLNTVNHVLSSSEQHDNYNNVDIIVLDSFFLGLKLPTLIKFMCKASRQK